MKKSVVIALHAGCWIYYLSYSGGMVGATVGFATENFLARLLSGMAFGLIYFYLYYLYLFPKYLAKKRIREFVLWSIILGILATPLSLLIQYLVVTPKPDFSGFQKSDDHPVAILITMFLTFLVGSFMAVINGMFGALLRGFITWYDEIRVKEALMRKNLETELALIKAQLNPHFLFNSLNSVAMLVRRGDASKAVQVVAGLSDLLRQLLADTNGAEVSLEQELTFVKQYLAIEQARFGDALRTEFDVAAEAMRARVPSLLLQPIVENAVRHGAGQVTGEGVVVVRALRRADRLVLEVIDNGPGPQENERPTGQAGLGLRNTIERLTHLHGDRFEFALSNDGRSTVATIELPYSTTPNVHQA